MEREARLGLGVALIVGLLISLVLYLAPGALPSAFGGRPTSEEVVQAFQAEDLEVGTYYPIEEVNEDGTESPLPNTYVEGTRFTIPSLEEPGPSTTQWRKPDGQTRSEPRLPEAPEVVEPAVVSGDSGGRVFVFENQHDLDTMRNYYENGMPHLLGFATHLYEEGLVLIQINDEFPKDKADEYGEALKRVA